MTDGYNLQELLHPHHEATCICEACLDTAAESILAKEKPATSTAKDIVSGIGLALGSIASYNSASELSALQKQLWEQSNVDFSRVTGAQMQAQLNMQNAIAMQGIGEAISADLFPVPNYEYGDAYECAVCKAIFHPSPIYGDREAMRAGFCSNDCARTKITRV